MKQVRTRARASAVAALTFAAGAMSLPGCAQRIIAITSEPEGALVTLNDVQVGRTPVEVEFTYFGVYDVRLSKPGFEPLSTSAEAKAPLHEWPIVDIFAAAIPTKKVTRIDWHFTLEPARDDVPGMLERAASLRGELGAPTASGEAAPASETTPPSEATPTSEPAEPSPTDATEPTSDPAP